jgi:glycosyltransferase involved in cell wall biosynthesis
MHKDIAISVVVPTCNRKSSLLRLLLSLTRSQYPIQELIIVDSGDERFQKEDLETFLCLNIQYLQCERSVCIQRNKAIQKASASWIFLCDDDLEVPPEYLKEITDHIKLHPNVGAVSGLVLQNEGEKWDEQYPIVSAARLIWNFIFQLSIWGEVKCKDGNPIISKIKLFYKRKGNHISKAGWPVLTDFSGDYFKTPIYGLGASVVKREWLLKSPYDEVLDAHGIGDNYGVAVGFPSEGIHVLKTAFVYHHRETVNRPLDSARYLKRILALDYFVRTRTELKYVHTTWFVWSLVGNLIQNIMLGKKENVKAIAKSIIAVVLNRNPYLLAAKHKRKIIEPSL